MKKKLTKLKSGQYPDWMATIGRKNQKKFLGVYVPEPR